MTSRGSLSRPSGTGQGTGTRFPAINRRAILTSSLTGRTARKRLSRHGSSGSRTTCISFRVAAILALLLAGALCVQAEDEAPAGEASAVVQRPLVRLRSGPGPIFPVTKVIKQGTLVKTRNATSDERWLQVVSLGAREGDTVKTVEAFEKDAPWIAARDLNAGAPKAKKPVAVATEKEIQVAAASVAACVRGFDDKVLDYLSSRKIDPKMVKMVLEQPFTPQAYEQFRTTRMGKRWFRKLAYPLALPPDFANAVQMDRLAAMVGTELAARLGGKLCEDPKRRAYVAMVGTLLGEASPRYDLTCRFVILQDAKPNSFCAPGGIVVITTGVLDLCRDESELAAVLGHEIGHVILQHGEKTQKTIAKAVGGDMEGAFKDLADATRTPPDYEKVDKELESMAQWFLSVTLLRMRRMEEEHEADRMTLYLLARVGYDVSALSRLLGRISPKSHLEAFELRTLRNHPAPPERLKAIQKASKAYADYEERRFAEEYRAFFPAATSAK